MKGVASRFIGSLPSLFQKILYKSLVGSAKIAGRGENFVARSVISERRKDPEDIRIAFFSLVLNGSPWLRLNIENVYPFASQIFIIEGATKADGTRHYFDGNAEGYYTTDGHSTDDTLKDIEYLKSMDVGKKITTIKKSGPWNGKTEMCNSFMDLVDADYLWQLDVDEFYKREDIRKIKTFLKEHTETTCVQFYAKYFIGSFDSISVGEFGNAPNEWNRIFKVNKHCRWTRHEPPMLADTRTGKPMDRINLFDRSKTREMGIYMYHYSYVTQRDIIFKEQFFGTPNLTDYLIGVKRKIDEDAYPIKLTHQKFAERGEVYLVKFDGEHPLPIRENLSNLRSLEIP